MGRYVLYKGSKIHYSMHGQGKVVVFLHGFTESMDIWRHFSRKLSTGHTVLSIDLPGHGRSKPIQDVHSMEMMAETVHAVMKEAGIHSCMMVGHSMGGYVALAFAERYPRKLKGLSLFHSHAAADSPEAAVNRDRTIGLIEQDKKGFIQGFIPTLFDSHNIQKYKSEITELKASAASMTREGIISALRGMKVRPDRTHILVNSNIPVQFIIGKNDAKIPMETIIPQTLLPAHSEITLLDNVGHMGFIEAREKTFAAIGNFARLVLG